MSGKINMTIGCMYSGKSTEILKRYKRYTIAGKKCLLVKHSIDIRYDENMIVTHDNIKENAISCSKLSEIDHIVSQYNVICIDEIQFFDDAPEYCDKWANNGLIIEVAGLNGSHKRSEFRTISMLIPISDDIQFVKGVCRNGNDAVFTKCLINTDKEILVGGTELYSCVDRITYFS